MDFMITPNHTGFNPKRKIHENIVVAQETLHNMKKVRGKKGYFSIKLDLAKAYDNISQSFVEKILDEASIPIIVKAHIMEAITTTKMRVQWKEEKWDYFDAKKG